MSYDIELVENGRVAELDERHNLKGGMYALGGTRKCWLNVTYNYAPHFYRVLGEDGIRTIYGMTGRESIPLLEGAVAKLDDDVSEDYWEATEGNAKRALQDLLVLARAKPDATWRGD